MARGDRILDRFFILYWIDRLELGSESGGLGLDGFVYI